MSELTAGQNVTIIDQHGQHFTGFLYSLSDTSEIIDPLRQMWTGMVEFYGCVKFVRIDDPKAREVAEQMIGPITAANHAPEPYDRPGFNLR